MAIVPAAGRGRRFGAGINKVFCELGGQAILAHTLRSLQSGAPLGVVEVVVALGPGEASLFEHLVAPQLESTPPVRLVVGGRDRQESVYRALQAAAAADWILVHDGARPLLSRALLERCLAGARRWGCVVAALPVAETIKEVDASGVVQRTLPREPLYAVQTPQVFPKDLLLAAHERARAEGFTATDDAALVERLGYDVRIVPGEVRNIKITRADDLQVASAWLEKDAVGRAG